MAARLIAGIIRITALTDWSEVQSEVDSGKTTPDLTVLFVILAVAVVAIASAYVLIRLWKNARREKEVLERGTRAAIPHIKSLDNNLPASSLSSLYKQSGRKK